MRRNNGARILKELIRAELSAMETYRLAMEKVSDEPEADELRRIASEHREAVSVLRQQYPAGAGPTPESPGIWGGWERAMETASTLFGNEDAVRALQRGEENDVKEYEKALSDKELDPRSRSLISSTLLPQTKEHIPTLDRFLRQKSRRG